jgi:hypothetical protein
MLRLVAPDGAYEIRHLDLAGMRVNVSHDIELEVVATEAHTTALFACSHSGWLEASVEGGGFSAVPTDVQSGLDLSAFSDAERKTLALRVTVPPDVRDDVIGLLLGIGV